MAAFDDKLAYLVARYAHSPGLLAWELFNEVELIQGARRADFEAWMRDRDQVLQRLDRYQHPVTTSYSSPCWTGCTQPWGDEAYDLPQVHSYLPDYWLALRKAAAQMRTYGKPAIAGEVGIDFLGQKNLADVDGAHLVNLTLLAALLGFEGGGMSWWWDNWLEPNGLWSVLGRAAGALEAAGIAEWRAPLEGLTAAADVPLEVVAAETSFGAIVWLHDPRSEWDRAFPAGPEGEVQAVVPLPTSLDCRFGAAVFLDPRGVTEASTAPGPLDSLTTPRFRRDLLVRLECPPPPADDLGSAEADGLPVEADVLPVEVGGADVVEADEARSSGGCAVSSFR